VKQQLKEMTLLCEPFIRSDSSLECSDFLRFCRGRNIMVNMTNIADRDEQFRWDINVLKQGEIGGFCKFHENILEAQAQHISALQSWGPELRNFLSLDRRPIESDNCDVVIEKPTFIMKIDSTSNMYHHFCDFFNLYVSQHVNFSHPSAFSTDVQILIWETYDYWSPFSDTFKAFTHNEIWNLKHLAGQVVCFKNVVLPLLPRMIYGLFYNTVLVRYMMHFEKIYVNFLNS
jgi:EGF domain-specific O-GlcNAc transferase